MWLKDKNIFIVGASSGIGKQMALNAIDICNSVTILSSSQQKIEGVAKLLGDKCSYYACDVRDYDALSNIIDELTKRQQIDAVVYCAGGTPRYGEFETYTYEEIKNIIDVNLTSFISLLKLLLPYMKTNTSASFKKGHILAMSSRSGERALPGLCPYAAAKGALERLVDGLQKEYARFGLAFSLICPGSIHTAFTDKWDDQHAVDKHIEQSMGIEEVVDLLVDVLNFEHVVNRLSFESMKQWQNEAGVLCEK